MAATSQASFERCCRLCAEEQEVTVMIFSEEAEVMLLKNKLNKYLLIEVDEDDKLPKNICVSCCTKLQTVCEFIDTARRAQDVLITRSKILEQILTNSSMMTSTKNEAEPEVSDDESKCTGMEVSVDPMVVLQNSEVALSPNKDSYLYTEDVTYLHDVDGENVTIKLIKRSDIPSNSYDEKKERISKPFPCSTCKCSFVSELALRNHSWAHINENKSVKQHKCNTCFEYFKYKCELINHLKEHRINGMCQLCGRMFRSEKTYTAHMSVHLSTSKSFTCKICGRSYNTWSNLRTHSITHSNERPYQCHYCKKTFKRNQDLKFHINQHTGAKPYKCPFCDKCFASSGNCYSHRNRMHPGRRVENKIRRWNVAPRDSQRNIAPKIPLSNVMGIHKYQCQLCDHSFMKKDKYMYHMFQHTGEKTFQCLLCPDKFVTRKGLTVHHAKKHPMKEQPPVILPKNTPT